MTKAPHQRDITRALKAAEKAGFELGALEVLPGGAVRIVSVSYVGDPDGFMDLDKAIDCLSSQRDQADNRP
jgi:hypothetical protein